MVKQYKYTTSTYKIVREKTDFKAVKVGTSKDAEKFARQFYLEDLSIYESFFILLLNRSNTIQSGVKISQGGTSGTVIDFKIIAKFAIESLSHGIILVHNHPSGNLTPSEEDKRITEKTKQGLKLFDIQVLDHLILTENNYFSFADEGMI